MRVLRLSVVAACVLALIPAGAVANPRITGDFNGDGADDLVIGVPNEDFGGNGDAGVVHVIYGSDPAGLTSTGNQLWHQDSPAIKEVAEASDQFGASVAAGDFNGDGFDDLAIGAPADSVGGVGAAGVVNVLYGSLTAGLTATDNQVWHQDSVGIMEVAEASDQFGWSLAAGDFDSDADVDLAVAARFENAGGSDDSGLVHVLHGSDPAGLSSAGNQLFHQDSPGIMEVRETDDQFGYSLAAGDFDADGADDLAICALNESLGGASAAGVVQVLYGSDPAGLTSTGNQVWSQDSPGIMEVAEADDRFGGELAIGDFGVSGQDDLAIGVSSESFGGDSSAGVVQAIYGSPTGLTATGNQLWHQDSPGIMEVAEAFDQFGSSLAAGNFNEGSNDDLAVGAQTENGTGFVHAIYGSPSGLTATFNQLWHQDSPGILEVAEFSDFFGSALAPGDFDGDGAEDLAAAANGESFAGTAFGGVVHAIYGADPGGLASAGNQLWHQNSSGILEVAESDDLFGSLLD